MTFVESKRFQLPKDKQATNAIINVLLLNCKLSVLYHGLFENGARQDSTYMTF